MRLNLTLAKDQVMNLAWVIVPHGQVEPVCRRLVRHSRLSDLHGEVRVVDAVDSITFVIRRVALVHHLFGRCVIDAHLGRGWCCDSRLLPLDTGVDVAAAFASER